MSDVRPETPTAAHPLGERGQLGPSVGCARCHDHKFDPVPQADYYRIKAVFAGVQRGERPLASPSETRRRQLDIAALERERDAAERGLAEIRSAEMCFVHSMTAKSNTHGPAENQMANGFTVDGFPSIGAWVTYALGSEGVGNWDGHKTLVKHYSVHGHVIHDLIA